MRFLIEINPSAEVKNESEKRPDFQKKVEEAFERMKPLAAWYSFNRYGFIIVEAESNEELNNKVAPLWHLFKTDFKISPAFSRDEFRKLTAARGEQAKKYGY